jgi:hypothetical protein
VGQPEEPLFETSSMQLCGLECYHLQDPVPVGRQNRFCSVGTHCSNCLILSDIKIVRGGQDPLGKAWSRSSGSFRVYLVGAEEQVMSISGCDFGPRYDVGFSNLRELALRLASDSASRLGWGLALALASASGLG